jgi:hypothetical protein
MDASERAKKPKHVEKPQNHGNNNHTIQNRFYCPLHRYKTIDKPQQNANNDQKHYDLN